MSITTNLGIRHFTKAELEAWSVIMDAAREQLEDITDMGAWSFCESEEQHQQNIDRLKNALEMFE